MKLSGFRLERVLSDESLPPSVVMVYRVPSYSEPASDEEVDELLVRINAFLEHDIKADLERIILAFTLAIDSLELASDEIEKDEAAKMKPVFERRLQAAKDKLEALVSRSRPGQVAGHPRVHHDHHRSVQETVN